MLTKEGCRNEGWLNTSKKSARISSVCLSWSLKRFITEKSQFCWRGPRKALRGVLPKPVTGKLPLVGSGKLLGTGGVTPKQVGFRYPNPALSWFWILPGVYALDIEPQVKIPVEVPPPKALPPPPSVTENGRPLWRIVMPLIPHPSKA